MDIAIAASPLSGSIPAIPSKSAAHRLLICAALADGPTALQLPSLSDDIEATIGCLAALGTEIKKAGDTVTVTPIGEAPSDPLLDCRESGSTLRFLLPVAAALCEKARFMGGGRLPERPVAELMDLMRRHGVSFSADRLPFETAGRLTGGEFVISGSVSSQYLTGLLLALPMMAPAASVRLSSKLVSSGYVDMTLSVLARFGVDIACEEGQYTVSGPKVLCSPARIPVDGDWSNAAFFLAAGAIGAPVAVTGLGPDSPQGDRAILALLQRFGANVTAGPKQVTAAPAALCGCEIDLTEVPDLLPVLAVVAACARGETRFTGGARLRHKESNRLASTAAMIRALGGKAEVFPDGLTVTGGKLTGGTVDSFHDHRIAMAAAVAGSVCPRAVTILGAESVNKSYPAFFSDYAKLGGKANVL